MPDARVRFQGVCYRAHDPRWSFLPLSGDGAAIRGGRFNPKGVPALYLALSIVTAVKEISHGLARRIDPCVVCSYDIDCADIVDLRSEDDRARHGFLREELACAWMDAIGQGRRPASWAVHDRLRGEGAAGVLVPSFAVGADGADHNLVLWRWGPGLPHRVEVFDPSGRLPRNQLSWS